jgi:fibro-slime domain-containing protein
LFANASAYTNNFGKTASNNYGLTQTERSLGYLFGAGDKVVDAYAPKNTILQYNKSAGKYYYDSSKNAVDYDDTTKLFRLRGYVESGHSGSFSGTQTFDFFPFNHCSGIVKGTEFAKDSSGTYTLRQKNYEDCAMLKSMANGEKNLYSQAAEVVRYNNIDYWFGMTMEFNFAQGKNGRLSLRDENGNKLAGDGKQMIFNFSGDDDVWVFIDGVLSLDLGGTHSIVNGSINFSTGEIIQAFPADKDKVYNTTLIESFGRAGALKFNGATKYYNSTTKKFDYSAFVKSGEVPDGWKKVTDGNGVTSYIFDDYSVHNLKFYYLERGGHVANNKIEFYMSTFSNNSLLVEKQVTPANDPDLDVIKETQEYTFRVLYTDENGVLKKDSNGNYISVFEENHPFILRDYAEDGSEINTLSKIAADGTFKLKDKQTAIFENMNDIVTGSGTTVAYYVVQELLPDGQVFQYDGISVNSIPVGANTEDFGTNTGYTSPMVSTADTNHVRFTNKINKEKLHNLEIIKNLAAYDGDYGEGITADTEFPFEVIFNDGDGLPVGSQYYVYDLDANGNVVTDSQQIKNVEIFTETVEGVTTNRAVIKIKNKQKAVIKGILEGTEFELREIFDAETSRYTVTYTHNTSTNFNGECLSDANGVNCTMSSADSSSATVTITVKNARKGVRTYITLRKIFKNAEQFSGAPELSFKIYLHEIVEPKPNAARIPESERTDDASKTFAYTIPITNDTIDSSKIYLQYPDIYEPGGEPTYYYYKIYESLPSNRPEFLVTYDTSVYVLTVKVQKALDGTLSVSKESLVKYSSASATTGVAQSSLTRATFTNTLKLYSLPTTGANLFLNTRAFSLLGTAMVVSLLVVVLVCVRKRKNGVF